MKTDIYQKVTDKIIADLEQGELTWLKPWSAGNMDGRVLKPLRHNGQEYSGINVLMLWGAAVEAGFCSPHWMTFKQTKELGAHVRKGERGAPVVYAGNINQTEEQENGEQAERVIPFMKSYTVFNVEQIEGLPDHYYAKPEPVIDPVTERIRVEHQGYSATLKLYETEKGYWHLSCDFHAPDAGSSSPASVWNWIAFTKALAARHDGIKRLLERCDQQKRFSHSAALAVFRRKIAAEMTLQISLF